MSSLIVHLHVNCRRDLIRWLIWFGLHIENANKIQCQQFNECDNDPKPYRRSNEMCYNRFELWREKKIVREYISTHHVHNKIAKLMLTTIQTTTTTTMKKKNSANGWIVLGWNMNCQLNYENRRCYVFAKRVIYECMCRSMRARFVVPYISLMTRFVRLKRDEKMSE